MDQSKTTIDLKPLQALVNKIQNGSDPRLQAVFKVWGRQYESFIRKRFIKLAKGGADADGYSWPKLSPMTIAGRRKGKGKSGNVEILRDTGTLLNALTIGAPGNHFNPLKDGFEYGFGGSAKHPSGFTITDLAIAHDEGKGRLPERKILVPPDQETMTLFETTLVQFFNELK